jgi:hypothetical protein
LRQVKDNLQFALAERVRSPFKLLDYYVEADADIFGGRGQEIFDITARLASRGILVLYGPSGFGKTSLIQAGVFPSVRRLGWHCAYVRTLTNPFVDLTAALEEQLGTRIIGGKPDTDPSSNIIERIKAYADEAPLLITFDQFEEFFIRFQNNRDLKTAFIELIAEIESRSDINCRILFSIREDYFAHFNEFQRELPRILDNSCRVGPLSAFGAREAITKPLLLRGIPFDNRLISELLDRLEKFNFDPAFLQIVCGELVRVASERDATALRITRADLQALGGIEGIFQRYLDNAIDELPEESRLIARLVLDALISRERTKQAMRIDDLLAEPFVTSREELAEILAALRKFRILRRDVRQSEEWFELVHEWLIPLVQHWIRADSDYFNFVTARDLVEFTGRTQVKRRNPEALLNRGAIEDVVGPYATRLRFDHERVQFVLLSCIYRQSPAVDYWAQRYGRESAMELLLLAAARSDNEGMRLGAMAALKRLDMAPSREVLDACLALSLNDPSEPVRRMAGAALGRHGQEADFAALRDALHQDATRARALDVYADMAASRGELPAIGVVAAFKARHIARRRQLRNYDELRRQRANLGLLYGAAAAVAWSLTVSPILLLSSYVVSRPQEDFFKSDFAGFMVFVFPTSVILGLLLGRTVAASAARRDALGYRENWVLDVLFARVAWVIVLLYVVVTVPFIVFGPSVWHTRLYLVWDFIPLFYGIMALVLIPAVGRECIGPNYRSATVIWWGGFAALVASVFVAGATVYLGYQVLDPKDQSLSYSYASWLQIASLEGVIGIIALSALTLPRLRLPVRPSQSRAELSGAKDQ